MRILDIVPGTSVDGPGLRTSIYFAGCRHLCPGCHNPDSWDMAGGRELGLSEVMAVVEDNGFNVTLSGGDPLYQIDNIVPLCQALRDSGYTIWLYTGFTYEQIASDDNLRRILPLVDVIVDGPFMMAFRDTGLRFRGSSNQRIINVKATIASDTPEIPVILNLD